MRPHRLRPDLKLITCCRTMNSVNKLLTTKAKRNVAKRKICILLDLAKLNKYQERLESVAADLEVRIHPVTMNLFYIINRVDQRESRSVNVNMTQILLDVIDEHIKGRRPQDRRISNSEGGVVDDGHVKQKAVEKTHKEGNNLFGKHKKQVKYSSSLGGLNITDVFNKTAI